MSDDTNLESVMQRIGRILSYDRNLIVEVRGKAAYSVPGRVVIPRIESYANLGHGAERMLHGLLDHEVGHAKHTDHSLMEEASRESKALASLFNAIEDGRVERLMGREFPGCATNLRVKNRWFWTLPDYAESFLKAKPYAAYCLAVTLWLRGHVTLDEIRTRRPDTAKLIDATRALGLDEYLASSADALRVSRAIYATFKSPPPPPSESDDSDESDESDESGDSDESADSDESDEEEEEPGGIPEPGDEDAEGEDAEGEDAEGEDAEGEDAEGEDAEGEDAEGEMDPYEGIRGTDESAWSDPAGATTDPESAVAVLLGQEWDGTPYRTFDPEAFDLVRDFDREPPSGDSYATESIEAIERGAAHASHALASAFEVSFRARRERRPVVGADEGDIEIAALLEYATGSASSDTIYSQFVAEEAFDTAVSIVIDCSGSMQATRTPAAKRGRRAPEPRSRSALARRAAYAMSLALSQCAIVHEITGFTSISSRHHPWFGDRTDEVERKLIGLKRAIIEARDLGKLDPATLARECGPHYRYTSERDLESATMQSAAYAIFKNVESSRLDGLRWAFGIDQNLDGEAVLWNAKRLAMRPEKRRVMLVLSDGVPAGATNDRVGAQYLKDTVKRVEDAGIEVYGVGIETDAPKHFYSRSWIANSVDHLVEVAMGGLVEILTEGRQECDNVRVA